MSERLISTKLYMRLKNLKINLFTLIPMICLLFSLLIFTGCVTTQDMGKMQWEINEIRSGLKDLREKSPTQGQREKNDKTLLELQNAQEATSKTISDLMIQFQSLASEFRILTGRFEESRYYMEKTSTEMGEEKERLAAQLKELELSIDDLKKKIALTEKAPAGKPSEETKATDEGAVAVGKDKVQESEKKADDNKDAKKTNDKALEQDVKDVYLAGYQAYKDGKTAEARAKLTSVIKDYPDNEYSDNARFWIAESYYKEGNYEDAILAYEELIKKNPKSDKIPGAMLKQGLSFYALKDERTGRIIFEKLIEQFPNSEQTQTAKKKIGSSTPSKKK